MRKKLYKLNMKKNVAHHKVDWETKELNPAFPSLLKHVVTVAQNLAIISCGHSTCYVLVSSWVAYAHSVYKP